MKITPVMQKFVLHWGEMGTRWGINRSVAQIHALLFVAAVPLPADEIVEILGIARSNVSMSLKELQGWGLVRTAHTMGDRRDHFETQSDVWELFRVVLMERKKREADPTLKVLRECVAEAKAEKPASGKATRKRLEDMLEFFELANAWGDRAANLSPANIKRLLQLGDSIFKLVKS
jgi:DNA-binding transcriptional regulator GbsR (MarR family)